MKKLRQFEIDVICDETYNLIKEQKKKQIQSTFDEFEGKEELLELTNKLLEKDQQIKQLKKEEEELFKEFNQLKETLRQKDILFNIVYNNVVTYDISIVATHDLYRNIHNEIILQGIDDGNSVREFIKELVEKFK
jgi:signal recognition particle GTPase